MVNIPTQCLPIITGTFVILHVLMFLFVDAMDDIHGGVEMGKSDSTCDNAMWNIQMDWIDSSNFEYKCQPGEKIIQDSEPMPQESFIPREDMPRPLHKCMNEKIVYTDLPPRAGPHRPLWPRYGEYLYVPPQRWVHSLEHGGAVFLYHPCANPTQIEDFKNIAKNCLWKHIITPYRGLKHVKAPFAIVTYGRRLTMNAVDRKAAIAYVKKYALKAPEGTFRDGQYDYRLEVPAKYVSNKKDKELCPGSPYIEDNSNPAPNNKLDNDFAFDWKDFN